jgi:translation initiation factor RLI1
MAGKLALVDYRKCDPTQCAGGVCTAALACPRKVMRQEDPYEAPMSPSAPCTGCAECVLHCSLHAVELVTDG